MIFDDDMYSFIPEEPEDDEEETLEHSSQWVDENGNNTPAYNHKYWIENRDEIMARRRFLQANANKTTGQYTNSGADAYLAYLEANVNNYLTENRDRLTVQEQKLLYEELLKEKERINSNREERKTKSDDKKSSEEMKDSSKDSDKKTSDSGSNDDSSSSNKSKSSSSSKGSSGSSSGSSKSSSSKSGGGSSGSKSGGAVTPGVDPIKGGAKSSSGSKEKTAKEKSGSGKEKSGSGSKNSSDKSSKDNTKNQQPSEDNSPESVAFSKIKETGYEPGNEPTNSYASFIREIRERTNYEVNDAETGLALWREYRRRRGMDTSDALIAKNRTSAEEDIRKRQSLQHGLELFEYYSMSPDMRDGYDRFNELMLEHHGIMGMKWGVQNGPPYPLDANRHSQAERKANWEQSLSAAGRKLRGLSEEAGVAIKKTAQNTSAEIHKRREASRVRKAEKAERARREAEEKRISDRRNAISSGDRKYADENFNDMSSEEINALLSRADLRAKVDKYNGKEGPKNFKEQVDNIMQNVDSARKWADTGINTWNTFAKVYNSFTDDKLLVIGESPYQREKEKRDRDIERQRKARDEWFNSVSKDPIKTQLYLDQNVFNADEMQKLAKMTENKSKVYKNLNSDDMSKDDQAINDRVEWYIRNPDQQTTDNFKEESNDVLDAFYNRAAAINNAEKASRSEFGKGNNGGGKKSDDSQQQNTDKLYTEEELNDEVERRLEEEREKNK